MPEVLTIGETMVLLSPERAGPLRYVHSFSKSMAGAESNVAIGLARLGHSCGLISRVGGDEFGRFILRELRAEGVDTAGVRTDNDAQTGVMFKEIRQGEETRVYYYRKGSAASRLGPEDIGTGCFDGAALLHVTGITPALSASCRDAVDRAMNIAREKGITVSFDPNIRLKLWSEDQAKEALVPLLKKADIVLAGTEEAALLVGSGDPGTLADRLLTLGVKTVALKIGAQGCLVAGGSEKIRLPAFSVPSIVDTVGAGDAFAAGFLSGHLEERTLKECGLMGCAMGAFALSTAGDTEGLPFRRELDARIKNENEIFR